MPDSNVENTMSTRDRVRAMVREVLATVPTESEAEKSFEPEHVVVNSLKEQREREYDRDESSKTLITEDDLRGLDEGLDLGGFTRKLGPDIFRDGVHFTEQAQRQQAAFIAGFVVGDLVWFTVAAAGLAVVARTFEWVFVAIRWAGAALTNILIYIYFFYEQLLLSHRQVNEVVSKYSHPYAASYRNRSPDG
jgi:hypothetical protein